MTNPFEYYTLIEILTAVGSLVALAVFLVLYNTYYLKKRSGIYLIMTLLAPTIISMVFFIFGNSINVTVSGFNSVFVAWLPLLYSFCHTVYFISMLHREKQNIKEDLTFNFLKTIKKESTIFSIYLLLILAASFAILPTNNAIALSIGVGNIVVSTIINTVIIIKKI